MSLDIAVEEESVEYFCNNKEDINFSNVIGCIEDMLMHDEFYTMQRNFLEKYYDEFEEDEENKLIYMDIFKEYQTKIEVYIEKFLKRAIDGFCMNTFIEELLNRRDELEGEIFEMLFTLSDFLNFKEMFLDYKAMKEGKSVDFSRDISITKYSRNDES